MTARSTVAIHLTESVTWARAGDRTVDRPAGVAITAGRVGVAVDRSTAASDEVFEPSPIRYVGDDVLLLGGAVVDVAAVLEEVLADAIGALGAATPVDRLVLTCPSGWGTVRRRALVAAGRRVAREVRTVPVAEVAATVANPDGADRFGIVLEIGMLSSEATVTAGGSTSVDSIGAMDLTSRPESVADLVDAIHPELPDHPEWVAVVGVLPPPVVDALARKLRERWGADVPVCEASERQLLESASEWGLRQAGPLPVPHRETKRDAVNAAARRRRIRSVVAIGVLVLAGVAGWSAFTAVRGSDGAATVAAPQATGTSASNAPGTPSVSPHRVSTGRAALDVPAGWHRRTASDGSDRVELVRDDGRPARILLVQKDLRAGADLDAVAVTLADQIAERSATFGAIDQVEFDGRPALSYLETPDDQSQVVWRVFVVDGLQISVGCQAPLTDPGSVDPACGEVSRSITVAVN
ncbi:type VII secretion-associated protein [Rhodococcus gannanensis]|uniref:Type VII secretion-associated protein n=1 Tax=Rhodococcus gannanensis TaxID=1960308 RepID=A0ABW4P8A8_9NOCA